MLTASGGYRLIQGIVSYVRFTPGQAFERTDTKNFKAKPVFTQDHFLWTQYYREKNTNQTKHESQDICQCPQRMKLCPLCVFTCHYLGFNSDYGSPSGARGQELLVSFLQSVKVVTVEKDFHLKELIKRL